MRVAGETAFYFTLFNLGELIHSPQFIWTLALFEGNDNHDNINAHLQPILQELQNCAEKGLDISFEE